MNRQGYPNYTRRLHFYAGVFITLFIVMHLFNHIMGIFGAAEHIDYMHTLRPFYRNPVVESILLLAVSFQIYSGTKLFIRKRMLALSGFERLQIWSGLYLAFFFIIHVSAVFVGRKILDLDTNFYFGVAGLNTFPLNLFFIPYYILAITAFFGHISAIHNKKMTTSILGLNPSSQSKIILFFGVLLSIFILFGLTNYFQGVTIPHEYNVLIGK
jgi:hypothetical protein